MQRLTQAPSLFMATLWASALTASGIAASVQRQYLSSVAGELPPDQCLPEVWIDDARQEAVARDVLYPCNMRRSGAGTAFAASGSKADLSNAGSAGR